MRWLPTVMSVLLAATVSTTASADHFDRIEDAAEDYARAADRLHDEIDDEKYVPAHLKQLTERLKRAADRLEDLADDERSAYEIGGAFEQLTALHFHVVEDLHRGLAIPDDDLPKRIEELYRRFDQLSSAVELWQRSVVVEQGPPVWAMPSTPLSRPPLYDGEVYQGPVYEGPIDHESSYPQGPVHGRPVYAAPTYQEPMIETPRYSAPPSQAPLYVVPPPVVPIAPEYRVERPLGLQIEITPRGVRRGGLLRRLLQ